MASWGDEVEKSVNTIVAETRITLDTGLLCKNIIVLSLEVTDDFTKTSVGSVNLPLKSRTCVSYLASLSIWSPNPGVSTIVNEMRVPSSSNSNSASYQSLFVHIRSELRTNGDRLDSDTFLEMCICRIVGILCLEDFLSAKSVDKGSST